MIFWRNGDQDHVRLRGGLVIAWKFGEAQVWRPFLDRIAQRIDEEAGLMIDHEALVCVILIGAHVHCAQGWLLCRGVQRPCLAGGAFAISVVRMSAGK